MSIGGSSGNTSSNGATSGTSANQALSYLSGLSTSNGNSASQGNGSSMAANSGQLQNALDQAQATYQTNPNGVGYGTVQNGAATVNNGATQAVGLDQAGNGQVASTLNGDYLSAGNPYFQQMVTQAGNSIKPTVDSGFEANGRYGSGAHAAALDSALSNTAGNLAYTNYAAERSNQVGTAASLPSYTAGLTQPGQAQIGAGQAQTAAELTPLNSYIAQLQSISPGQVSSNASASANNSATANQSTTQIGQTGQTTGLSSGSGTSDNSHAATK
jgi:hypothetical protein